MNKIVKLSVAVVLTLAPFSAFASTTADHYYFYNNDPKDQLNASSGYAPFNVQCNISGINKGKVSWSLVNLSNAAKSAQGIIVGFGNTAPIYSTTTNVWVGTDIATTTIDSDTITVKYKATGLKTMYGGVTNGYETEMISCSTIFVDLTPPTQPHIINQSNGIEIDY